jgi:ubiquinone/menaquinone biosynthesis C-methylase UbiE
MTARRDGEPEYLFDREAEERRLRAQSRLFDPLTRRLLDAAGLAPGMRVLDLGAGVGDTSILAAQIVGPAGSVVGVDVSPAPLVAARRRAASLGLHNVEFVAGDARSVDHVGESFDAVIGRLVLMYIADPVAAVRSAAARLRPGGLVCFQEVDATFDPCFPASPLWTRARAWLERTAGQAGVELRMGPRLFHTFSAAGLEEPEMRLEAAVGGGAGAPAFAWADVIASMLPLMERFGIATAEEVGPETLADRLLADLAALQGIVIAPLLFGAWSRTPS